MSRCRDLHAIFAFGMSKRPNQTLPNSFEDALRQLEEILAQIESGDVGLEESLVKYERGNFLIKYCRGVLSTAEKQIENLSKGEEVGRLPPSFLWPFSEHASDATGVPKDAWLDPGCVPGSDTEHLNTEEFRNRPGVSIELRCNQVYSRPRICADPNDLRP